MTEHVHYESCNRIATITLDRGDGRNAMNASMLDELAAAWARFEASEDRVAILAASGNNFCFGADVRDLPVKGIAHAVPGNGAEVSKPIISCVQGWVVGAGLVLALMSDLCIAAEGTQFLFPEAKLGVFGGGMIAGLVGHIPYKVAMEIMLTSEPLSVQRAHEVGFVNQVVPQGEQLKAAMRYAERIAQAAPLVISAMRDMAWEARVKSGTERYAPHQRRLAAIMNSADLREGLLAQKEKRMPHFTGR